MLKVVMLESIIKIFFRGFFNFDVKYKAIKDLILFNYSLLNIYNFINKTRRIKLTI